MHSGNFFSDYWELAKFATVGILGSRWPVTLFFSVFLVIASLTNYPFGQPCVEAPKAWLLAPLIFPLAILAAGACFAAPAGEFRGDFAWQSWAVYLLFLFHTIVGVWIIYRLRGLRWFASSVILMQLWLSSMCASASLIVILNVFI
jgi:hypothetical protein